MNKNKEITLILGNIGGGDVIVELFHARANRCESYAANHLNVQPGFVSTNIPLLTAEGILKAAVPDVNGLVYWLNDRMYGTNNAGTGEWNITSANTYGYSYRAILNYLLSKKIKVGKVKLQSATMADIKNTWTIRRYFLDGSTFSNDLTLSNSVPPNQVQNNILEFDLNEIIDGDTAIEVLIKANSAYSIIFYFEEIN